MTQIKFLIQVSALQRTLDTIAEQLIVVIKQEVADQYVDFIVSVTTPTQVASVDNLAYGSAKVVYTDSVQSFRSDTTTLKEQISDLLTMYELQYGVSIANLSMSKYRNMTLHEPITVDFDSTLS